MDRPFRTLPMRTEPIDGEVLDSWLETASHRLPSTWDDFTGAIKRRGGGLPMAEMIVLETLTTRQRRDFAMAFNPKLVVRVFQEMYGGGDACKAFRTRL